MADTPPLNPNATKIVQVEPKYEDIQDKSFQQIGDEIAKPEKEIKAEVPPNPLDEAKKLVDEQKKIDEEARKKDKAELEDKIKKVEESTKTKEEKVEEVKELKSKWQEEGRNPNDYDEILQESVRIAREEVRRELADKEAQQAKENEDKRLAEAKTEEEKKQIEKENLTRVNNDINDEMEEIYKLGYLVKPTTEDPEDPAVKARNALFQKGIEINSERVAKGEPPIRSIFRIYDAYYKPTIKTQPAGADAPISGNRTTPQPQPNNDYVYQRDHGKGWHQIAGDIIEKVRG